MEYVYDTTLKKIQDKNISWALKYIEYYWFANFYTLSYRKGNDNFTITLKGKNLIIEGKGTRSDLLKTMITFLDTNVCDKEILDTLSRSIKFKDGRFISVKIPPKRFLHNVANSCALDAILSIMLFARGGYFIAKLQESTPVELRKFPRWIEEDLARKVALEVEEKLLTLYNDIDYSNVRELQRNIALFLKEDCNDVKAVYEIWGVFCLLFDALPVWLLTPHQQKIGNTPTEYNSIPIYEAGENYVTEPLHLVYVNDAIVEPTDFKELIDRPGYELVGVIYHKTAHYTAAIKIQEQWYSYDDLESFIRPFEGDVLKQTRAAKIVMLFYTKL